MMIPIFLAMASLQEIQVLKLLVYENKIVTFPSRLAAECPFRQQWQRVQLRAVNMFIYTRIVVLGSFPRIDSFVESRLAK